MSGFGRLFFTALGSVALFIGLSEPTNKTSVDQTLKEITDQRPDAFMQGFSQRKFDRHGRLETTLTATSLLDFGGRANAKLINPKLRLERQPATAAGRRARPGSSRANAVNSILIEMKYSSPKTSSQIVSKTGKIPGTLAERP